MPAAPKVHKVRCFSQHNQVNESEGRWVKKSGADSRGFGSRRASKSFELECEQNGTRCGRDWGKGRSWKSLKRDENCFRAEKRTKPEPSLSTFATFLRLLLAASDLIETANISQTHSFPKRTREILIDTVYRQRRMTSLRRLLGLLVVHCGGVYPKSSVSSMVEEAGAGGSQAKVIHMCCSAFK